MASLAGFPKLDKIINFRCDSNRLTSLEGCPREVENDFACNDNQLMSLEGCPSYVGRLFYCYNNDKKFSKRYIRELCEVQYGKIKNTNEKDQN